MKKVLPIRLLVVEGDTRYGEWLRHHLGVLCPDSTVNLVNPSQTEAWSEGLSGRDCDVLMVSASFGSGPEDPQAKGLDLLRQLRAKPQFPAIIVVAEEGNELTAVRALQLGAVDYLPKRLLTPERLKTAVNLALRMMQKRVAKRIATLAEEAGLAAEAPAASSAPPSVAPSPASQEESALQAKSASPAASTSPAESAPALKTASASAAPATTSPPLTRPTTAMGLSAKPEPALPPPPSLPLPLLPPPSPAMAPGGDFMPADFIPGYVIHGVIGESEKAAVYVATSVALRHNVALKVSKTLRDDAAGRQFLEREYTAIAAIHDPCVVEIYDYGVRSGYEYLVMEYLPRGDLKGRMRQELSERQALRYLEQIAMALQVVHQAGLLHRDLKPPNVMLRENDDVALIDFGLARALDGSTPSTRVGVLRGSPYYMSPEQALGEVLDARSDFYSLGIIFYEMLTGRKPYIGGSAMDVLQQHVNAAVPRLPMELAHHETLLLKLLAKSRDERFATASQLIEALQSSRAVAQMATDAA